jgi:hypothetical protein
MKIGGTLMARPSDWHGRARTGMVAYTLNTTTALSHRQRISNVLALYRTIKSGVLTGCPICEPRGLSCNRVVGDE